MRISHRRYVRMIGFTKGRCALRSARCAVRYCRTASGRRSIPRPSRTAHRARAHVRTSYIAFLIAPSRSCFPPTPVYTTLPALSSTTTYDVAGTSHFPVASPFASQSWIPGT